MIGMEDTGRLNRKQHAEQTVLFNKLRSINQPFNFSTVKMWTFWLAGKSEVTYLYPLRGLPAM